MWRLKIILMLSHMNHTETHCQLALSIKGATSVLPRFRKDHLSQASDLPKVVFHHVGSLLRSTHSQAQGQGFSPLQAADFWQRVLPF